jgi:hypothetical protein
MTIFESSREFCCAVCGHILMVESAINTDSARSPEFVRFLAMSGPWIGIVTEDGKPAALVMVCSRRCLDSFLSRVR